ncbi:MAG: FAD-dependent oxidoreductase [Acidobacteriota bacterium]|nr:MAG: FAD-dependent oxidoreductase [Acidobacteriota bacterium]
MGRNSYKTQSPDASEYWIKMIKCQDACPVHTNACGYVTAISEGRYKEAYRMARATNPFASICGRVCGAPCEVNCRRGDLDEPVSIRALKRFVTDQFGPETGNYDDYHAGCDERMLPPERGDYEKVAVIGGGVSGMTVAHDLIKVGYKVTVFEADPIPGGMLITGVPVFRLPRDLVQHEINAIVSLGVDLKCNMKLGRDFSISDLREQGFKAIFLGMGLPKGRKLDIPGANLPAVYDGLEFLRSFNEGKPLSLGRRVVVIGGGNVAYDVARSAVRPREESSIQETHAEIERGETTAYDVARSALRLSGDKEVHVVCLEQRHEMPADLREIIEGEEEGIHLHNGWGPREIVQRNGSGLALRTVKCNSVFDENGRFSPQFEEDTLQDLEADTIMFAIGQTSDLDFLQPEDGVATERGLIKVDLETYQTTAPDIFACGDIAHGPRLFINAIASAQIAARSMHDYLRGTRTDVVVRKQWLPASYTMVDNWELLQRSDAPLIESEQRATSVEVIEEAYSEPEAQKQGARCLRCNVNTIFDTSICIACNGCVDVCPEGIIELVGLSQLLSDEDWQKQAAIEFQVPLQELQALPSEQLDELGAVMLKDETTCIRCAFCATRCPTHAITMQEFKFYRECVTVPARNPKIVYGGE